MLRVGLNTRETLTLVTAQSSWGHAPFVGAVHASAGPWRASRSRPKGPRAGHDTDNDDRHHQRSAPPPQRALEHLAVSFLGMLLVQQYHRCQLVGW